MGMSCSSADPDLFYTNLPSRPNDKIAYRFFTLSPLGSISTEFPEEAGAVKITRSTTVAADGSVTSSPCPILLVFVNGLILPMTSWIETINNLLTLLFSGQNPSLSASVSVSALLYDRYGQGLSKPGSEPGHDAGSGRKTEEHSFESAVVEMQELLNLVLKNHYPPSHPRLKLLMTSQSIGVPLTRLFTSKPLLAVSSASTSLPSGLLEVKIAGHLFLDSNISTADYNKLIPDPSSPSFKESSKKLLPPDSTVEQLRQWRKVMLSRFSPEVKNPEGLDRSYVATLVPSASVPKLEAQLWLGVADEVESKEGDGDGNGNGNENERESGSRVKLQGDPLPPGSQLQPPFLSVLAHDPITFANESERSTNGLPGSLVLRYLQPEWEAYNAGLATLVPETYLLSNDGAIIGGVGDGTGRHEVESGEGRETGLNTAIMTVPALTTAATLTALATPTTPTTATTGASTEPTKAGVSFVTGAGHFIQRDRPDVVAAEIYKMVNKISERSSHKDIQ